MADYFVTSTPTICDGTVVRWFGSEEAMRYSNPVISASRNGVMGGSRFITPELFHVAWEAHLAIKRGDDVSHLVTHRSKRLLGDEYVPVNA